MTDQVSLDGITKAELVKKIHEKVKENLNKKNECIKRQRDKGRKKMEFAPGDWVWLHMRPERFPNKRSSKLAPRGDGPFKIIEKINDNAYRLELPGEFHVTPTFNVSDLSYFDVGEPDVTRELFQEGENDVDIQEDPNKQTKIPPLRGGPMTRARAKSSQGFKKAVSLWLGTNQMDINKEITEPKTPPLTPNDQGVSTSNLGTQASNITPQNEDYLHNTEWPLMRTKKVISLFVLSLAC